MLACRTCGQRFSERRDTALFRARLSDRKLTSVVEHLADGCGIRTTSRLCRVHPNTVARVLLRAGRHALRFHDCHVRGLKVLAVQIDEKRCVLRGRRLLPPRPRGRPEEWLARLRHDDGRPRLFLRRRACWDHICLATQEKLVIAACFGRRGLSTRLVTNVSRRINNGEPPVLVESDEWKGTVGAVDHVWICERFPSTPRFVHAVVHKIRQDHRVVKCIRRIVQGDRKLLTRLRREHPSLPRRLNTSFVERYHTTDRHMVACKRRCTANLATDFAHYVAASWLAITTYNFCRTHRSLGRTPAQACGIADHQWSAAELLAAPIEFEARTPASLPTAA